MDKRVDLRYVVILMHPVHGKPRGREIQRLPPQSIPVEIACVVINNHLGGLGKAMENEIKSRLRTLPSAHDHKPHAHSMGTENCEDARGEARV